jgi:hypothetical protein
MNIYLKFFALSGLVALGCREESASKEMPKCVENLIHQTKEEGVSNPTSKVYRYLYQGKTVYYISPECCDSPSTLVDEKCNVLCSPDGSFTGNGDGQCTDFVASRSAEKLIWQASKP